MQSDDTESTERSLYSNSHNKLFYNREYIKLLQIKMQQLGEKDPHYVKFSEYVELYNDGKRCTPKMNKVLEELAQFSKEEKDEILEIFDAKITRKKEKEKIEDVKYYELMKKDFMYHCINTD